VTSRSEKQTQESPVSDFHSSSLRIKFLTLEETQKRKHVRVNAQNEVGFQEQGGPRSVSGEPMEESMITESNGAEMLLHTYRNGPEISNVSNPTK
jgi:hypothetical protein